MNLGQSIDNKIRWNGECLGRNDSMVNMVKLDSLRRPNIFIKRIVQNIIEETYMEISFQLDSYYLGTRMWPTNLRSSG